MLVLTKKDIEECVSILDVLEAVEKETEISGTTFFKSVGMALFDLLTAEKVYNKAIEKGIGTQVEF